MKIKRFKNLWTMGLILIVIIYAIFFLLKVLNPSFVVGVAELQGVVKFGTYIDSQMWAYYLFNGLISFVTYYVYCCACCRKKYLNYRECTLVLLFVIIGYIFYEVAPVIATPFNNVSLVLLPAIILFLNKTKDIKCVYSIAMCFSTHTLLQYVQSLIKDISTLISYPNSATFTILTIDGFIWLVILYLFYNKGGKQNG